MTEFVFKTLIFITIKLGNWFIKLINIFICKIYKENFENLSVTKLQIGLFINTDYLEKNVSDTLK